MPVLKPFDPADFDATPEAVTAPGRSLRDIFGTFVSDVGQIPGAISSGAQGWWEGAKALKNLLAAGQTGELGSTLRGPSAAGTRGLASLLAMEGGLPGAAISGAGESLAERLEGSPQNLARIGVESSLGAVPFGKVFSAGRPIASALKGAAMGGVGTAGREWAEGQPFDPASIAKSALMTGALTGGTAKVMGWLTPEAASSAAAAKAVTDPTDVTGREAYRAAQIAKAAPQPPAPLVVDPTSQTALVSQRFRDIERLGEPGVPTGAAGTGTYPIAYPGDVTGPEPYRSAARRVVAEQAKATRAEAKAEAERLAREKIGTMMGEAGVEPKPPTFSESLSAPTEEGGRIRATTRYGVPEAEEPDLTVPITRTPPAVIEPPPAPLTPPTPELAVSAPAETQAATAPAAGWSTDPVRQARAAKLSQNLRPAGAAVPQLSQILKTPEGATGRAYRGLQEDIAAGRVPSEAMPAATDPQYGIRAAHLREIAARKATEAAPSLPEAAATTPDWVTEQLNLVDRLKKLASEESGGIDPAFAARLGMGAAGAAIGGATDPFDNRALSALAGGAAGLAAPSVVSKLAELGVHPNISSRLVENLHPENIKEVASKIYETLPNIQRFNYLTTGHGLAANVFAGPYGAATMAGLERGLSGDPRGWEALRLLSDIPGYLKQWDAAGKEAVDLARRTGGRAELTVGSEPSKLDWTLATPGIAMTAGDVAARDVLERAGFTADEARTITLTSEPRTKLGEQLMNVGRGSPLGGILFPFKRTVMNIAEQGAQRTPILGPLAHALQETGTPLKEQMIQQAIGTGVGGVGYGIGSELEPDQAKIARRYLTNFAGQYSLPAALGMAMGMASHQGKPALSGIPSELSRSLPLPTTEPITDWAKFGIKAVSGEPMEFPKDLPPGSYPKGLVEAGEQGVDILSYLLGLTKPATTTAPVQVGAEPDWSNIFRRGQ